MPQTSAWNRKTNVLALRISLTGLTGVLVWLYPPDPGPSAWLVGLWLAYLASTVMYVLTPAYWFSVRRFFLLFLGLELLLLGGMLAVYLGAENWVFYPLFLLVVLLAALARRLLWALVLGGATAAVYLLAYVNTAGIDTGVLILQVAILMTTAGVVGYLIEELEQEEETSAMFDNALEIAALLAGTLETEMVYERLTEVVARLFNAARVAVILTDSEAKIGHITAAIDRGEPVHDLDIDLEQYPEIRQALEKSGPVVIQRAETHPRLAEIRGDLPRRARAASILVTPILPGGEPRGVLFVRLEDTRRDFGEHEVKFCHLMADVAARAVMRAEHFAEVAEAARRDSLTGLFNVRVLQRRLAEEIERSDRSGSRLSVVMIDVDYLKHVNDTYGHLAGDKVIKRIAEVLTEELRGVDTIARYGGEEFVLLLPETGGERAVLVAERIRKRLAETSHEGVAEPVTVSIGISNYPDDAMTASDLIHKADQALYVSKHLGRNRSTRFDEVRELEAQAAEQAEEKPEFALEALHDPEMIQTIRDALKDLDTGRALLRHLDVIASLTAVMRAKDPHAIQQLRDVSTIADLFLAHLPINERQRWAIHVSCLLRDIGKLAISDEVLQKRDILTREEYQIVRRHPVIGAQVIQPLQGFEPVVPLVRHHHERWDGKGYPDGLEGDEIPYGARVVGLVDAFYAMVRRRPYADRQRGLRYAIEEIRRNCGTQFDPELAERFLFVIDANHDIIETLVSKTKDRSSGDSEPTGTEGETEEVPVEATVGDGGEATGGDGTPTDESDDDVGSS